MTYTPPAADQDADELLQQIVDAQPVLDHTDADIRDAARLRLMQDIAYGIYPAEELAVRYGLGTVAGMRVWLQKNPETMRQIKVLKALHQSDTAITERNRLKANHAIEQTIPSVAGVIMDPSKPLEQRLKAFGSLQKMAGLDGAPPQNKEAATGAQFNLVMQFAGAAPFEIKATTVAPETVQTIETTPISEDDDKEFDEDV